MICVKVWEIMFLIWGCLAFERDWVRYFGLYNVALGFGIIVCGDFGIRIIFCFCFQYKLYFTGFRIATCTFLQTSYVYVRTNKYPFLPFLFS